MPSPQEKQFLQRVTQYPVVNDTYNKVADYYIWAKRKHPVVNKGLNLTESAVQTAYSKAQPVINKFDSQITYIDKFTCHQLDVIESKYPIILKPTDEVVQKTKELYESQVKTRVNYVVQPVMRPVYATIHGVNNGVSAVSKRSLAAVMALAETRPGQMVISRLHDALDLADRSVDRFLPPIQENEKSDESSKDESTGGDSDIPENKETLEDQSSQKEIPIARVTNLTSKVRRRMYSRAMRDLKQIRIRSEEAIKNMTHSVDLIAYARNQIDRVKTTSLDIDAEWRNAMLEIEENEAESKEEEQKNEVEYASDDSEDEDETESEKKTTDRALLAARYWSRRLRIATTAASVVTYRHLPKHIQEKFDNARTRSIDLYNAFHQKIDISEIKSSFLDNTRNAIQSISDQLESAFEYVKASSLLSWLYRTETSESHKSSSACPDSVKGAVKDDKKGEKDGATSSGRQRSRSEGEEAKENELDEPNDESNLDDDEEEELE